MKKSRKITLTVLAGLTLTGCLATAGCGGPDEEPAPAAEPDETEAPDHTWYDENGTAIPERWRVDENGDRVLDSEGRPIPEPGVPHDRHGRPFMYHGGVWLPPLIVLGHSAYYGGGPRPMPGGGYRGPNSTTPYRGPNGSGSRPVVTPPAGSRPSGPPSGSAVGRTGFGSTGAAASSGGAS